MKTETVNGEIVEVAPSYLEDTSEPPKPFEPDPMIEAFRVALAHVRGNTHQYKSAMIILESDDDDKGGAVTLYKTRGTSRDRALVMVGKAGELIHSREEWPTREPEEKKPHYVLRTDGVRIKCGITK
jgi:hypothetical protein